LDAYIVWLCWFSFPEHYFDEFVRTMVLIYAHMIVVTMLLILCTVLALETLQTDITAMLVAVNMLVASMNYFSGFYIPL
jgi:hypothetical protein